MPIVIILLAAVAVGGVAYGSDQHNKRIAEQETARQVIRALEQRVAALVAQLQDLERRYGRMSTQYYELAQQYLRVSAELQRLRAAMGWAEAA